METLLEPNNTFRNRKYNIMELLCTVHCTMPDLHALNVSLLKKEEAWCAGGSKLIPIRIN